MKRENRNTILFIGFFLLAGILYALTRSRSPLLNTVLFAITYMIYEGLLIFWIQSVHGRLLPSRSRTYSITAAGLMMFYLFIRSLRYRFFTDMNLLPRYAEAAVLPSRYLAYAYYLPMTVIPTLYFMVCLRISRKQRGKDGFDERLLLVPALFFSFLFLTNDLHHLVYIPTIEAALFKVDSGTYVYGPVFWPAYLWIVATEVAGVFLLVRAAGKFSSSGRNMLLLTLAVWITLMVLLRLLDSLDFPRMYNMPEIFTFGFLAVFEICIRNRMIPHNENYIGFFEQLGFPAVITDKNLNAVYRTDIPVEALPDLLRDAIRTPIYPEEDTRLSGMAIRAGYAFWTEDERELHKERRRLAGANALLEEENDLIAVENRLKEKKAKLDAQNQVYNRIAAELWPRQKRIEELLQDKEPGTEEFKKALAECCVYNAWSKRKGNLLLLSEETLPERNRELFLALQESVRYLKVCGIEAAVMGEEYSGIPLEGVLELYDAFEEVLEAYLPYLRRMTVSLTEDGIRLAMESGADPELPPIKLPAERKISEDITFLAVRWEKGGVPA